ncbi:MAG: hypothetical protein LUO93_09060 [Methanomicrobiales archaeon]|nr:hypothetical protein [Methanomicrobiales archaeon]
MKTREVQLEGKTYRFAKPTIDAAEAYEDGLRDHQKAVTEIRTAMNGTQPADLADDLLWKLKDEQRKFRHLNVSLVSCALERAGDEAAAHLRDLDEEQLTWLAGEVLRFSGVKELPPGEPLTP